MEARPGGPLWGTGMGDRVGEKGKETRCGQGGERGAEMKKRRQRDRRTKEGGGEGSRNQKPSQGDPEFSRLCLAEKEVPCVLL